MTLLMWYIFCKSFGNMVFSDACFAEVWQMDTFVQLNMFQKGITTTYTMWLIKGYLSDIAAVMSASAHIHAETVGSTVQEHHESTDLYFPFLLVSAHRITSVVAWYWYTRIDLWLWSCWLCMSFGATRSSLRRRLSLLLFNLVVTCSVDMLYRCFT
jgi:hypothetical protein